MLQIKIYREARTRDMPRLKLFAREYGKNELYQYLNFLQRDLPEKPALKTWICEIDNQLVGVAIGNVEEDTMPVMLVHPGFINWDIESRLTELLFKDEPQVRNKNILPVAYG